MISQKLKTFAHDEFSSDEYSNVNIIKERIKKREDLFKKGHILKKVELDKTYPDYITQRVSEFNEYILD